MAEQVQLQVKREGAAILVAELKKMKAEKAKKQITVFEQAVLTMYELILYRLTDQMTPADAALVEAAALAHRNPVPTQLPYVPDA
jgi:hypothetical protein